MKKSSYFVKGLVVLSLVGTMAMADGDRESNDNNQKEIQVKSSIQLKDNVSELNEKKAAKLGVSEVINTVKTQFSGKVLDVQLENLNGNLVYQADILDKNQVTNVFIDAGNGKILSSRIDQKDKGSENDENDGEENNDG